MTIRTNNLRMHTKNTTNKHSHGMQKEVENISEETTKDKYIYICIHEYKNIKKQLSPP